MPLRYRLRLAQSLFQQQAPVLACCSGKNTAHVCATEEGVVVNLDGDNIIGPHFLQHVMQEFARGYKGALHYHGDEGTYGRIACRRNDFLHLGGYDEDSDPAAFDMGLVSWWHGNTGWCLLLEFGHA